MRSFSFKNDSKTTSLVPGFPAASPPVGGRGLFGTGFTDGFADGERCDVSFATFVEEKVMDGFF